MLPHNCFENYNKRPTACIPAKLAEWAKSPLRDKPLRGFLNVARGFVPGRFCPMSAAERETIPALASCPMSATEWDTISALASPKGEGWQW